MLHGDGGGGDDACGGLCHGGGQCHGDDGAGYRGGGEHDGVHGGELYALDLPV